MIFQFNFCIISPVISPLQTFSPYVMFAKTGEKRVSKKPNRSWWHTSLRAKQLLAWCFQWTLDHCRFLRNIWRKNSVTGGQIYYEQKWSSYRCSFITRSFSESIIWPDSCIGMSIGFSPYLSFTEFLFSHLKLLVINFNFFKIISYQYMKGYWILQ